LQGESIHMTVGSPTDTPDLWIPERNEEDIKFVCESIDGYYSDQKEPVASVGTVDCTTEEKVFQRTGEGWSGHTDFVTHRPVLVR
jgi:hypothetical protein